MELYLRTKKPNYGSELFELADRCSDLPDLVLGGGSVGVNGALSVPGVAELFATDPPSTTPVGASALSHAPSAMVPMIAN